MWSISSLSKRGLLHPFRHEPQYLYAVQRKKNIVPLPRLISLDRSCCLVIITRHDITKLYMEEKQKNEQLLPALRKAQPDLLTNIYNHKTTADIVYNMLSSYQHGFAAILFYTMDQVTKTAQKIWGMFQVLPDQDLHKLDISCSAGISFPKGWPGI